MATKHHNPMTHTYYYLRIKKWQWARFKSICAKKGKSMRSVIGEFIDAYVKANN